MMVSGGPHVLLIDDDKDMHDSIKAMLEPDGYRLSGCWTGPSGLGEMRRAKPAVVLLDIMLSSPTEGLHLAKEIQNDETINDIPIIMISAIGQTMGVNVLERLEADRTKVFAFLEKPLDGKVLRDTVKRALSNKG
jgi:DNA-binding NtrC family response regulator